MYTSTKKGGEDEKSSFIDIDSADIAFCNRDQ
jgi:hypothetical protein